ncbi:hypothetical protein BN59_00572 [Legionella massiliensis]|uniref:Uncharacterized protein n=1 Tax=Legionella massiliensis TaxID=1034943 RepID=A0A078KPH3_9GAMM|nr:hypothetical protein BN59_00572 [Legionella massiliensis]CEE12043.1 hypothetical protein BN1094_00572 [Legionella massiliensis]
MVLSVLLVKGLVLLLITHFFSSLRLPFIYQKNHQSKVILLIKKNNKNRFLQPIS